MRDDGVYLYWIPLGAGGTGFVRLNGRVYEWFVSRWQGRTALDLFHTALEVSLRSERFVIETMWPQPDHDEASRGVVARGPVFHERLAFTRRFRYEVRRWPDGVLPDADQAVGGPRLVSDDPTKAQRLLDFVGSVPALVWGRDQLGVGDMWNSNSVISWLLTMSGVDLGSVNAPTGGRAPGWEAGMAWALTGSPGVSAPDRL